MRPTKMRPSTPRDIVLALVALAAVIATSVAGQIATFPNLAPWYSGLVKPAFNPPDWIFGPVWTALYALMAFASWRILRLPPSGARFRALLLYAAMLVLNAAWSWMFFAAHSPRLGLINILPQLALILATLNAFVRLDRQAGWALLPLACWVAFASVLNLAIWRLNG
jgi:benzodiazapine receptor